MTVTLYHYSGDPKTVNKSLTDSRSLTAVRAYEPLDELRGYLIMSSAYDGYNYIKTGDSYYFIEDRIEEPGGMCRMILRLDVLMTYKDQIYNLEAVFDRVTTTTLMQATIPDNLPVQSYRMTSEYTASHLDNDFHFGDPTGVNDLDFIVLVGGKGGL